MNYDPICNESESELELEESGQASEVRRTVRRNSRPVRLSRSPARQAMPPPPTVPRPMDPLPERPMCEYERIQAANIAEREAEYLRIFGEPLDSSHGQFGWLNETGN